MKEIINQFGSNANVVDASRNFKLVFEAEKFDMPFFDYEDEVLVKITLWQISNIGLGVMDLFYGINAGLAVVKIHGWLEKFQALAKENERLKVEMLAHERFAQFIA